MIDTVVLRFDDIMPAIDLGKGWRGKESLSKAGRFTYFYYFVPNLPTTVLIKTFPTSSYKDFPMTFVEICSVQKLVFEDNFHNTTDLDKIISACNSVLCQVRGLEYLQAGGGILKRVDFCANHYLGDLVPEYNELISNLSYPHRSRHSFDDLPRMPDKWDRKIIGSTINGNSFRRTNISSTFYNKYLECRNDEAFGILRQETRLDGYHVIQSKTNLSWPLLKDLTPEIASRVLTKDLETLGLRNDFMAEDEVLQQLMDLHGKREGRRLNKYLGHLKDYSKLTSREVAETLEVSLGSVRRWKRILREAGVPLTMAPRATHLSKLLSPYSSEWYKNDHLVLGDTSYLVNERVNQSIEMGMDEAEFNKVLGITQSDPEPDLAEDWEEDTLIIASNDGHTTKRRKQYKSLRS